MVTRWMSCVVLGLGCGPTVGASSDTTGDSSGGTTGGSIPPASTSSTSSSSGATLPDPTTEAEVTTGTGATTGSSSGDGTECDSIGMYRPTCGPEQDDTARMGVTVDPDPKRLDPGSLDVDASCTVAAVENEDAKTLHTLACDEPTGVVEHVLEVDAHPEIDLGLAVGDEVHLRAVRNYPIDYGFYEFLVVHDAAGEIVAAKFDPYYARVAPEVGDVAAFYAPIGFAAVDMSCKPVPWEDPLCGGSFIQDPCPADQTRLAVELTNGVDTSLVWSGTLGDLGPLRVLAWATYLEPVPGFECERADLPVTAVWWAALRPG